MSSGNVSQNKVFRLKREAGNPTPVPFNPNETVSQFILAAKRKFCIPEETYVCLMFTGIYLQEERTLASYNLTHTTIIQVYESTVPFTQRVYYVLYEDGSDLNRQEFGCTTLGNFFSSTCQQLKISPDKHDIYLEDGNNTLLSDMGELMQKYPEETIFSIKTKINPKCSVLIIFGADSNEYLMEEDKTIGDLLKEYCAFKNISDTKYFNFFDEANAPVDQSVVIKNLMTDESSLLLTLIQK